MRGDLLRKVGAAVVSRLITFPLTASATLLTTYLLISKYGPIEYGLIALVSSLFLLLPFADLGLGAPVVNVFADQNVTLAAKFSVADRVTKILAMLSLLLMVLLIVMYVLRFPWHRLLGVSVFNPDLFNLSTTLAVGIFACAIPFSVGQRMLTGQGRAHIGIAMLAVAAPVSLAFTWLIIASSAAPILAAIGPPLGIFVSSVFAYFVAVRQSPGSRLAGVLRTPAAPRTLLKSGLPMLVIMISIPVAFQSHRIIISHLAAPVALAAYSVCVQLYNPVWSFISAGSSALWPIFGNLRSRRENPSRVFGLSVLAFATLGGVVAAAFVVLGGWAARLISGATVDPSYLLLVGFATMLAVQALQQVPGSFLTDDRGLRFQAHCAVLMALVSIVAGVTLTPALGAVGPPLATAFAVLFMQFLPGMVRVRADLRRPGVMAKGVL